MICVFLLINITFYSKYLNKSGFNGIKNGKKKENINIFK